MIQQMNQAAEVKLVTSFSNWINLHCFLYTGRSKIESSKETRYQKNLHVADYNISIEKVIVYKYV